MEADSDLVVEQNFQSSELSKTLGDLTVSDVSFDYRYWIC